MGAGLLKIPGRSASADFQCLGIPGKLGSEGRFSPESRISRESGAGNPGCPVFFLKCGDAAPEGQRSPAIASLDDERGTTTAHVTTGTV